MLARITGTFFSLSSGATVPGFGAAADDDVDLRAIGEGHGVLDVLLAVDAGDERQLALDDRDERFERPVDGLVRAGLGVRARLIEEAGDLVEPAVARALEVVVRSRLRCGAAAAAAAAAAASAAAAERGEGEQDAGVRP